MAANQNMVDILLRQRYLPYLILRWKEKEKKNFFTQTNDIIIFKWCMYYLKTENRINCINTA